MMMSSVNRVFACCVFLFCTCPMFEFFFYFLFFVYVPLLSSVFCFMFSESHVSLVYNSFTTLLCISLVNTRAFQMSYVFLGFINTNNIAFQILHLILDFLTDYVHTF